MNKKTRKREQDKKKKLINYRDYHEIMRKMKFIANPEALDNMARFGINIEKCYGISIPELRSMASRIGKDHGLAMKLWNSGIHDARILATMVDIPSMVDERQMDRWVSDFNSWDLCDQCCSNLFSRSSLAWKKAFQWSSESEEYIKRAGFVLMATLAVHDKEASDTEFKQFFEIIKRESCDERNFVKKAVNWALRQIGKRNKNLNKEAIVLAKEISETNNPVAKWIASNALRELTDPELQMRIKR
jgi:3-methyladenine DNA glycosylase AlkD